MISKQTQLNNFLCERIAQKAAVSRALQQDARQDEATFERIAGNVYGIFQSVLCAAVKACKDDDAAVGAFFLTRIQQIPLQWQTAYQQALAHGETEKMHIETIKLKAIDDILGQFHRIWEDTL